VLGIEEGPQALQVLHLAALGHAGETAGELAHHLVLVGAQLVDVDVRRGEADAAVAQVPGFFEHGGDVQQGLGRNAADVEADAAQGGIALHQHGLHPQVGGAEGGGIAARTGAQHQHLAFHVGTAAMAAGHGSGSRSGSRSGSGSCSGGSGRRRSSRCSFGPRLHLDQQGAFGHLVTELDQHFLDHTRCGRGHVHGGLVGFQGADGVIHLDAIAHLHEQVDDGHRIEIADIRDFDFHETHVDLLPG